MRQQSSDVNHAKDTGGRGGPDRGADLLAEVVGRDDAGRLVAVAGANREGQILQGKQCADSGTDGHGVAQLPVVGGKAPADKDQGGTDHGDETGHDGREVASFCPGPVSVAYRIPVVRRTTYLCTR